MFIYSRAVMAKILNDLKKLIFIFSLIMQTVYIAYLIYAIVIGAGILFVNIALLVLICTYTLYAVINKIGQKKISKKADKVIKKIYRRSKITVKAFTLAATIYGIIIASSKVGTLTIIFAAFTTIAWLLSVLLEIAVWVFEKYAELFTGAMEKDLYQFKKWLPGSEAPDLNEKTNQKLEVLGTSYENSLSTKKILRKAEKKIKKQEKRHERREYVADKVKSLLPKKKRKREPDKSAEEKPKITAGNKK